MKNKYIIDELFEEDASYQELDNVLHEFLYYRINAPKRKMDADVSCSAISANFDLVMHIFNKMDCNVTISNQSGSTLKYEYVIGDDKYRLDTMLSVYSILKLLIISDSNKGRVYEMAGIVTSSGLATQLDKLMKMDLSSNKRHIDMFAFSDDEQLMEALDNFIICAYSYGNQLLYPIKGIGKTNLNQAKGKLKNNAKWGTMLDDHYSYLKAIKAWYLKDIAQINQTISSIISVNEQYYSMFGEGEEGWCSYINSNKLGGLVDEKNDPIDFWGMFNQKCNMRDAIIYYIRNLTRCLYIREGNMKELGQDSELIIIEFNRALKDVKMFKTFDMHSAFIVKETQRLYQLIDFAVECGCLAKETGEVLLDTFQILVEGEEIGEMLCKLFDAFGLTLENFEKYSEE